MKVDSKAAMMSAGLAGAALFTATLFMAANGSAATPNTAKAEQQALLAAKSAPTTVTTAEAKAWAQARASDTSGAYKVYLAAFPEGAFAADAKAAIDRPNPARAAAPRAQAARYQGSTSAPRRTNVAAACRSYVDAKLSQPSRVGRTVGGAAIGCGVGAMAGGDDGRNCAVGAVVGAGAGAISAESRERRRLQEVQYCIANGGPPR
jgi:hypothetical protein